MNLENNVALVTGGASGLGRATVEYFVSKGAKAVILDINDEKAAEVIDILGSENVSYFHLWQDSLMVYQKFQVL